MVTPFVVKAHGGNFASRASNMRKTFSVGSMLLTAFLAPALAACATRGELAFMPAGAVPGTIERVWVSTARASAPAPALYSSARSANPQFARFDISVPPKREEGTVTFSKRNKVDPQTDFVVTNVQRLHDDRAFLSAVNAEVARRPPANRDAVLFIHGYNTTFAEGLFRQAQLQHDFGRRGVSVHFRLARRKLARSPMSPTARAHFTLATLSK